MYRKLIVVGSGTLTRQAIKKFSRSPNHFKVTWIDTDSSRTRLKLDFSLKMGAEYRLVDQATLNDTLAECVEQTPDLCILNINSFSIYSSTLLSSVRKLGIKFINFHNGPLPEYRGIFIPTWAILRDEKSHGITWHIVDDGIDEGDIIASRTFEIKSFDTAGSVLSRCFENGYDSLTEVEEFLSGKSNVTAKQLGNANYFSRNRALPNKGCLTYGLSHPSVETQLRAFDYRPYTGVGTLQLKLVSLEKDYRVMDYEICDSISANASQPETAGVTFSSCGRHLIFAEKAVTSIVKTVVGEGRTYFAGDLMRSIGLNAYNLKNFFRIACGNG